MCLNIVEKTLKFESQGQKYQTLVEFTPVERPGIFCIQSVEVDLEDMEPPPLVDGLSTLLLGMGRTLTPGLEPKWIRNVFQIEEEKRYIDSYE